MKKQKIKSEKGITLIALVMTILVLLVLAVVAVRAVQDGGLIKKSKEATTKYTEGQVREEVQLILNDAYVANNNYNTPLKDYLQEKFGEHAVTETGDGYEISYKGYITTVGKDYKIASIEERNYNELRWIWETNEDGETVTITGIDVYGIKGTGMYGNKFNIELDAGTLYIPSQINGKTVTDFRMEQIILDNGHYIAAYTGVSKIVFPNTIVNINGKNMFVDLTDVTIPEGVVSIERFGGNKLSQINLPSTLKIIGDYAFCSTKITNMIIPDGVTRIGEYAFAGCENLTSVSIGNGITSIGDYAFYKCVGLTGVEIPNGDIQRNAFCDCSSLRYAYIRGEGTIIGREVFKGCSNLQTVIIPSTFTSIGRGTFDNTSVDNIYYGGSEFPAGVWVPNDCTVHLNSTGPNT